MPMRTDWEADFDDLAEEVPLPGGRPRRRTKAEVRKHQAGPDGWDRSPRMYRLGGVDRELFPISALAAAMDRQVATIYSWERKGWLPQARMRSPRADDIQGHRLYSRTFIERLVVIAKQEGLFDRTENGRHLSIESTDFPAKARELMMEVGG